MFDEWTMHLYRADEAAVETSQFQRTRTGKKWTPTTLMKAIGKLGHMLIPTTSRPADIFLFLTEENFTVAWRSWLCATLSAHGVDVSLL